MDELNNAASCTQLTARRGKSDVELKRTKQSRIEELKQRIDRMKTSESASQR